MSTPELIQIMTVLHLNIFKFKVNDNEKNKTSTIFTHDTSTPISSFGNVPVTRNQNLSADVVICPGVFPVKIKISVRLSI